MTIPHLIRILTYVAGDPLRGKDVEAVRRGAIRYLDDDRAWKSYQSMSVSERRLYGAGMKALVKRLQRNAGLVADGRAGPAVDRVLRKGNEEGEGYDAVSDKLLTEYADGLLPKWCYPHPAGHVSTICQGLHQTAGLDGNWAMDFCAPGGTPVVCVVAAEVVKVSGRDPAQGADQSAGLFGWNLHYQTPDGYRWFSTHYGSLSVKPGQKLRVGQRVGVVGHWPLDEPRSHTHLGVTSPFGTADAKRWIERVAAGNRVK